MCLIVIGWQAHPRYRLLVAANRDEFHRRPAAPAAFWRDRPAILAGRDLEAMGTWMGVSRGGKFAAVTNYRGAREPSAAESRGALVTGFLANEPTPAAYMADVAKRAASTTHLAICCSIRRRCSRSSNASPTRRRPSKRYSACWRRQRSSTRNTERAVPRCCSTTQSRCATPSAASSPTGPKVPPCSSSSQPSFIRIAWCAMPASSYSGPSGLKPSAR
ncbi:MAG: NRDE family protein [Betaproteobacteria bacterium]|nr:MAG: NRDE family protein [Betaproteobacteria bacterium]